MVTGGGDSCRTLTKKDEEAKGQRKTFVFSLGKHILAPFSARSCLPPQTQPPLQESDSNSPHQAS